jgi:hypothetical protein
MTTLTTRFLGALALVAALIAGSGSLRAQGTTPFELVPLGPLTQTIQPGGYHGFFITVKNVSFGDISMRIVRTQNDLPDSTWVSGICSGLNCYPPQVSTTEMFKIKAGDTETTELTIVGGMQENSTAHIVLQYDMGPGTQSQQLEFTVKVSRAAGVPVLSEVANAVIYPNPTPGKARYDYTLSRGGNVSMSVSSINGVQVLPATSEYQDAGAHSASLDLSGLPAGVYMVTMTADGVKNSRLVTVTR